MPKIIKGGSLPFKMSGAGCGNKHYQNGGFLATLEALLAPLATPQVVAASGLALTSRSLKTSKPKSTSKRRKSVKKKTTKRKTVVKKKTVKRKTAVKKKTVKRKSPVKKRTVKRRVKRKSSKK